MKQEILTKKEMLQKAQDLARELKLGDIVFFYGDLGSGKTTFIKEILKFFNIYNTKSPTFSIIEEYYHDFFKKIIHIDFYRIKQAELNYLGIYDFDFEKNLMLIEWPDIFEKKPTIEIFLEYHDEHSRKILIKNARTS